LTKVLVELKENESKIINQIKSEYGIKNPEDAIHFIISKFDEDSEYEVRPEYLEKLKKIDEGEFISVSSIEELRKIVEED
jgi:hypothetical protein